MIVDARGKSCPTPVIMAKKAVETAGGQEVVVLVDERSAAENISRFAKNAGITAVISQADGRVEVRLSGEAKSGLPSAETFCEVGAESSGAMRKGRALLVTSDRIGADEELGGVLMRAMLNALAENEAIPEKIILMNAGVKMTVLGSDTADALKTLEERGVDVMACGTCLKYYGLMDTDRRGRVSNAYEILNALLESNVSPLI